MIILANEFDLQGYGQTWRGVCQEQKLDYTSTLTLYLVPKDDSQSAQRDHFQKVHTLPNAGEPPAAP